MRLCHKAQSVLWHPLSFRKERGERSVRGHCPLNPRAALSIFFSGKSTMTMLPKSAHTMRGPEAPGVRLGAGLKTCGGPNPRGRSPLCIVGFYDNGGEVLLGAWGAKPPASLCVLSPRGERTWPRIGYPFSLGQRFICADKLQHALQKRVWPAPPLLYTKKGGKEAPGGAPLGAPWVILIFRAIVGYHNSG